MLFPDQLMAQGAVVFELEAEPETDWSKASFWETVDGQPVEQSWDFKDGEISLTRPRGGSGSLLSGPLAQDFDLTFDWKM